MNTKEYITVDPELHSGDPVFTGTRVPIQFLFDYMESGYKLDDFLEQYPGVKKEYAVAVLELAKRTLMDENFYLSNIQV